MTELCLTPFWAFASAQLVSHSLLAYIEMMFTKISFFKKLVYKQPLYGRYEIYKRAEIFLGSVKFSSTKYSSSLSFLEGEEVSEQSS